MKHATREDLLVEEDIETPEININDEPLIRVEAKVGPSLIVYAIIDRGATHFCVNQKLYDQLLEMHEIRAELPVTQINLIMAVGKRRIKVNKRILFEILVGRRRSSVMAFVVVGLFTPILLGLSWLRRQKLIVDCESNKVIPKREYTANLSEAWNVEDECELEDERRKEGLTAARIERRTAEVRLNDIGKRQQSDEKWKNIMKEVKEHGKSSLEINTIVCTRMYCLWKRKVPGTSGYYACLSRTDPNF